MNKSAIKNFAVSARKKLIEQVMQKAFQIGITAKSITELKHEAGHIILNNIPQEKGFKLQRDKLIKEIEQKGYDQVMEEVAYTWFNRFIALRFMEVNDYLPTGVRVLSSLDPNRAEPDIIREALNVDLAVERNIIYNFQDRNDFEGLFKYLLIHQCNDLNKILPFMFETISDYTELLFPNNLLQEGSVIRDLVTTIPEEDWKEVEIIGWLYQYYISEKKDEVIQAKKRYRKEEIPIVTQLFTPEWIVRYMVQNSLGRYWIESHPEHSALKKNWEFYLENPNPRADFEENIAPYINKELKIEEIKCIDPACGSGHILVYMFDILYQIYEKCGFLSTDIPQLIIEKNIYGLDIDNRAYQLACFSVVMKATQYNKQFLRSIEKTRLKLNIASIQETNSLTENDICYVAGGTNEEAMFKTKKLFSLFKDAKIYGSLIKIDHIDSEFFYGSLNYIINNPAKDIFEEESRRKVIDLLGILIEQVKIIESKYDILITNPPYMGNRYMSPELVKFTEENYKDTKTDLFSTFVESGFDKVKPGGHLAFMTPFVWMFISSYEKLRKRIIDTKNITSLIQLEYSGFEEATVPICTFTLRNVSVKLSGEYIKLSDFPGAKNQSVKTLEAIKDPMSSYRYTAYSKDFIGIPGSPIAYWVSDRVKNIFENEIGLGAISDPRAGLQTGDNNEFLRLWYEVDYSDIGLGIKDKDEAINSKLKWFPYNKGGYYRKWYGNNEFIVNWENDGYDIKLDKSEKLAKGLIEKKNSKCWNSEYYFRKSITWSFISSAKFGARYSPQGFLFDIAGSSVFPDDNDLYYFTAFLCSKLAFEFLKIQNPTLNFQPGNIAKMPIIISKDPKTISMIDNLAYENISISKQDWDLFELSWDFEKHLLLHNGIYSTTLREAFSNWVSFAERQFEKLKANEENINGNFIEIYGLKDEMTPEVEDQDITIRKADQSRDIKSFISYAVGCMMGRYSLDEDGLIFAGGKFDPERYKTFRADADGILPVLSDAYFEDDIVTQFVEFVKVTFGENTLTTNLDYIAETLGRKANESSRECIRRYFLKEFYKDHVQMYKKRPIYWLFTSGKEQGFNALVYMHRYDSSMVSRVRTDYLHPLQNKLEAEFLRLNQVLVSEDSPTEKTKATKRLKVLTKQMDELKKYDEVIHNLADQQIEIDLDDGVVVNYAKFEKVLAKI